jgi:hypothetical protein
MAKPSIGQEQFEFWDKFAFVGEYPDGRKLWAVGQGDNGVMVADLRHEGELTLQNIPEDAACYPQRFLSDRYGFVFHKPRKVTV